MGALEAKIAFITAAGQGIGRAIAERFAAEGARVIAADRDAEALASLRGVEPYQLDVTNQAAVRAAAAQNPAVDILVNGVGYVHAGNILDCDVEAWGRSFQINVDSMYFMIRAFLPAMIARKAGVIINIASVASSIKGVPNRCAYGATKAAVIGLSKSVAADFVAGGIRCNAICPGTVESPSLRERLCATGDYEAALKAFKERQPMGRLGRPEEIAALATFLASDDGAFTTGQAYVIDGGWTT
ncbi:MAG: SDR family oxidoreductase [Alphaproteobacteria bacterium]|nr:SDR family oxidoreductase [Alphaproteobacteria bacterium]